VPPFADVQVRVARIAFAAEGTEDEEGLIGSDERFEVGDAGTIDDGAEVLGRGVLAVAAAPRAPDIDRSEISRSNRREVERPVGSFEDEVFILIAVDGRPEVAGFGPAGGGLLHVPDVEVVLRIRIDVTVRNEGQ